MGGAAAVLMRHVWAIKSLKILQFVCSAPNAARFWRGWA
jgi:hypothetical protein